MTNTDLYFQGKTWDIRSNGDTDYASAHAVSYGHTTLRTSTTTTYTMTMRIM